MKALPFRQREKQAMCSEFESQIRGNCLNGIALSLLNTMGRVLLKVRADFSALNRPPHDLQVIILGDSGSVMFFNCRPLV
jgi:hypothetical protein